MPAPAAGAAPLEPARASRHSGIPARRAVIRWAWRMFRREWRQQVLTTLLLTMTVGATVVAAGIGVNSGQPASAGFGTANHMVSLDGTEPRLAADIAAIRSGFGRVDVIENAPLATGLAAGADLRAQDPAGRYGGPTLALVSGRYPAGPGQVAMTASLASLFHLRVGQTWTYAGQARRLTGIVSDPQNLLDTFALLAPGQLTAPRQVTVLFDATPLATAAFSFPPGVTPVVPQPNGGFSPAFVVAVFAVFGLLLVGLVANAGFTVMAQRRVGCSACWPHSARPSATCGWR